MPVNTRRTAGDVLAEQQSKEAYIKRLTGMRKKKNEQEDRKIALDEAKLRADTGIRNRLANLEARQMSELEKSGSTTRDLAGKTFGLDLRKENRLASESDRQFGLDKRTAELNAASIFKGSDALDEYLKGGPFASTADLEKRPDSIVPNYQYVKPDINPLTGKPIGEGFAYDTKSGSGIPGFARETPTIAPPVQEAAPNIWGKGGVVDRLGTGTQQTEAVEGDINEVFAPPKETTEQPTAAPEPKVDIKGGKERAAMAAEKAAKEREERRDKFILGRLAKKRKSGKMTAEELKQFNALSKQYR